MDNDSVGSATPLFGAEPTTADATVTTPVVKKRTERGRRSKSPVVVLPSETTPTPPNIPELLGSMALLPLHDDEADKRYPCLMILLRAKYDERQKLIRQEGRLSLAQRGPVWCVQIECPTEGVTTSLEIDSLYNFLEAVEVRAKMHRLIWTQAFKKRRRDLTAIANKIK